MLRFSLLSFTLVWFLTAFHLSVSAGEFNPVLNIGDKAPAWAKLPGVDDDVHSLDDLKDKDIVVVVFTCNSCPYAVDVEDRLLALAKKYAEQKTALVAINVNKVASDTLPAMKKRAEEKGFAFPYLYDATQQIARDYGATRTPEFFVLNKERKVVYMGALDDSPDGKKISKRYVEAAIEAAINDVKPEVAETIAIGCGVRFDRKRRE